MFAVNVSGLALCANLKEHCKLGKFSSVFCTKHNSPEDFVHDDFGKFTLQLHIFVLWKLD